MQSNTLRWTKSALLFIFIAVSVIESLVNQFRFSFILLAGLIMLYIFDYAYSFIRKNVNVYSLENIEPKTKKGQIMIIKQSPQLFSLALLGLIGIFGLVYITFFA